MLSRRQLLAALAGAAAIAANPERALWVPGRKLISIPKPIIADLKLHNPQPGDWVLVEDKYYCQLPPGLYEIRSYERSQKDSAICRVEFRKLDSIPLRHT